jgi:hypothetical protein
MGFCEYGTVIKENLSRNNYSAAFDNKYGQKVYF